MAGSSGIASLDEVETTLSGEDENLARRAAAGDGAAFAELYDRHERRVFNFCLRLTTSSEDAADATQETFLRMLQRLPDLRDRQLNFAAYLLTVARNESYRLLDRRKRTAPGGEAAELDLLLEARPADDGASFSPPDRADTDPERAMLISDTQLQVQQASGRLPERHREVLALRELEELSYDEIAEIMDMNRNSVAQLISRARIRLRDELRGGALAGIAITSPECERALPLLSARADGEGLPATDGGWLDRHLVTCEACRARDEAMAEAGISYRAWVPIAALPWLRDATVAHAAELVGADWSAHLGSSGHPAAVSGAARGRRLAVLAGGAAGHPIVAVAAVLCSAMLALLAFSHTVGDDAPPISRAADVSESPIVTGGSGPAASSDVGIGQPATPASEGIDMVPGVESFVGTGKAKPHHAGGSGGSRNTRSGRQTPARRRARTPVTPHTTTPSSTSTTGTATPDTPAAVTPIDQPADPIASGDQPTDSTSGSGGSTTGTTTGSGTTGTGSFTPSRPLTPVRPAPAPR